MTAGERLAQLAGQGGTAASLLALLGVGATTGALLASYSGLTTGTAADHLLVDRVSESSGGGWYAVAPRREVKKKTGPVENDEAFLLSVLL